ncbi:MAG: glycosyltransferase family 39 protein [Planctomycetota bacterium]|nr:MAG: glycosyltransferase family 39 protein [Planctomycetota bacterium]
MEDDSPIKTQRVSQWMEVAIVTLLAVAVFSIGLGRVGLFEPDEARYGVIAKGMAGGGSLLVPHIADVPYLGKPPLVFWMSALAIKLSGPNEAAVRIVSVIFAALTVLMVFTYIRSKHGNAQARITAAVLVTCPFFWGLARTGLPDMPFTAFLTAAFISAHLAMDSKRSGRWRIAMYAALALAVMSKTFAAIPLVVGLVCLEAVLRRSFQPLKVFVSPVGIPVFLAIILPWFIALGIHQPEFLNRILWERNFAAFFSSTWSRPGKWWLYPAVIFGAMLPWSVFLVHGIAGSRPWRKTEREDSAPAFAFTCAAVVLLFFQVAQTRVVQYILPAFPALAILVGASLNRLRAASLGALAHIAYAFPVVFGLGFAGYAFFSRDIVLHGGVIDVHWIMRVAAVVWTVSAAMAWFCAFKGLRDVAFRCLIATAGVMMLGVLVALPKIDGAVTSRPHSMLVKRIATPDARIVDFGSETLGPAFYTDLPVYFAGKKVNLAFGKPYADPARFDPDLAEWNREGITYYLIIRPEAGKKESRKTGVPLYLVERPGKLGVMTNKPLLRP